MRLFLKHGFVPASGESAIPRNLACLGYFRRRQFFVRYAAKYAGRRAQGKCCRWTRLARGYNHTINCLRGAACRARVAWPVACSRCTEGDVVRIAQLMQNDPGRDAAGDAVVAGVRPAESAPVRGRRRPSGTVPSHARSVHGDSVRRHERSRRRNDAGLPRLTGRVG